jgi:putative spermidine/putrescine transport system permease protein
VAINLVGKRDAALSIAVSLAALLLAFGLLLVLSAVGGPRRSQGRA